MKAKKTPTKTAGNQMPAPVTMPRRGTTEYREAQRAEFNKRFDAQKRGRS